MNENLEFENVPVKVKLLKDTISNGIEDEIIERVTAPPKVCNFAFKEMFVLKDGKMTPENGFEENNSQKTLCPSSSKSCCTFEELNDLFQKVGNGFEDFKENL